VDKNKAEKKGGIGGQKKGNGQKIGVSQSIESKLAGIK